MIDQATNADGDSGRFKILNDWEHDDPAQAPEFKRDQHLTPAALFKAKVLAVLNREKYEISKDRHFSNADIVVISALNRAIDMIEDIAP